MSRSGWRSATTHCTPCAPRNTALDRPVRAPPTIRTGTLSSCTEVLPSSWLLWSPWPVLMRGLLSADRCLPIVLSDALHATASSGRCFVFLGSLALPALDGQAAHGGQHHDQDRDDQGRLHRVHERVPEDLLGELLRATSDRVGSQLETAVGGVAETVNEPLAEPRR